MLLRHQPGEGTRVGVRSGGASRVLHYREQVEFGGISRAVEVAPRTTPAHPDQSRRGVEREPVLSKSGSLSVPMRGAVERHRFRDTPPEGPESRHGPRVVVPWARGFLRHPASHGAIGGRELAPLGASVGVATCHWPQELGQYVRVEGGPDRRLRHSVPGGSGCTGDASNQAVNCAYLGLLELAECQEDPGLKVLRLGVWALEDRKRSPHQA